MLCAGRRLYSYTTIAQWTPKKGQKNGKNEKRTRSAPEDTRQRLGLGVDGLRHLTDSAHCRSLAHPL